MVTRQEEAKKGVSPCPHDASTCASARVGEWLESPYVPRLAARVAAQYHLGAADVPDLLQEILIALWKSDPNLVVAGGWLRRLAAFKAVDIIRKGHHEVSSSSRAQGAICESESHAEAVHLLHARIAHLPTRMQALWQLRYETGLTQEEVAARLGVSRTAIRWLDSQMLKSLGAEAGVFSQPSRTDH
jgi:RNA polymerase sigma factor (sigma-70 family)